MNPQLKPYELFLFISRLAGPLVRGGLTSQGNVAMKEASLEDEAQYAGTAHPLLLPACRNTEKQVFHSLWPNPY